MNHVMNGMDIFSKLVLSALGGLFVFLVFWWFYRVTTLSGSFIKVAIDILGAQRLPGGASFLGYRKEEARGVYKGREVIVGVVYSGLKGEFMPLPHICMRLKETVGYNLNRLPGYAVIDKNLLVFKVKISVLWGVFDRNYPQVFSKNYFLMTLEKLLAIAEDVERGRTLKEIFK